MVSGAIHVNSRRFRVVPGSFREFNGPFQGSSEALWDFLRGCRVFHGILEAIQTFQMVRYRGIPRDFRGFSDFWGIQQCFRRFMTFHEHFKVFMVVPGIFKVFNRYSREAFQAVLRILKVFQRFSRAFN